jgi:hypothetical protein
LAIGDQARAGDRAEAAAIGRELIEEFCLRPAPGADAGCYLS